MYFPWSQLQVVYYGVHRQVQQDNTFTGNFCKNKKSKQKNYMQVFFRINSLTSVLHQQLSKSINIDCKSWKDLIARILKWHIYNWKHHWAITSKDMVNPTSNVTQTWNKTISCF